MSLNVNFNLYKIFIILLIVISCATIIAIYAPILRTILQINANITKVEKSNPADLKKLVAILEKSNVKFNGDLIAIPSWVKHIKIDVGLSYNAPMTQKWLEQEQDLLVFAFEPNPSSIARIKSPNNVALKGHDKPLEHHFIDDKVFIIPIALGAKNSTMDFYITETDVGCSSLYKPKAEFSQIDEVIKVDVFTLHTFFELIPWAEVEYIEYLKIDAQGHDLEIVKGIGDYISKIIYITIEAEASTYDGCQDNTLQNIIDYMATKDFAYIQHPNTTDPTFINNKFKHKTDIFIKQ